MVDRPDAQRKLQSNAVALGGGIAVYSSLLIAFVAALLIDRAYFGQMLGVISVRWYVLFGCGAAVLALGLIDDLWGLRGRQKLLLQCLIVAALVGSGTVIQRLSLFGLTVPLGPLAFPITVLWLIVAVNALNLIDGADGMATTAGAIICIGLGVASFAMGSPLGGIVGISLAAAQIGFLAYNRPPATIYLGDAGSMMIGLFVGVLAIWGNLKESAVLSSAPVAILAIPLFDSSAAILRRWLTGRSIYVTDRAHLHHLLQEKYGRGKMLWVVAGLCGITATLSVMSITFGIHWLPAVGVAVAGAVLILTRSFGHTEARLVLGSTWQFIQSFVLPPHRCDEEIHQRRVPLQGSGPWDTIWEPLLNFAKAHGLVRLKISLSLPWLHEGYHAHWQSIRLPEKARQMNIRLPLFTHRTKDDTQIQIGTLEIVAAADHPEVYQRFADLGDQLAELTPQIDAVVRKLESERQQLHSPMGSPSSAIPNCETITSGDLPSNGSRNSSEEYADASLPSTT
ncbi:MraY family glycosyltransferase [Rubripirellula amarantea]|nr:MraY family glycosyltransferase [Rubripirellula amarantea]